MRNGFTGKQLEVARRPWQQAFGTIQPARIPWSRIPVCLMLKSMVRIRISQDIEPSSVSFRIHMFRTVPNQASSSLFRARSRPVSTLSRIHSIWHWRSITMSKSVFLPWNGYPRGPFPWVYLTSTGTAAPSHIDCMIHRTVQGLSQDNQTCRYCTSMVWDQRGCCAAFLFMHSMHDVQPELPKSVWCHAQLSLSL